MVDRAVRRGGIIQFTRTLFCKPNDIANRIDFECRMHNQNIWDIDKIRDGRKTFHRVVGEILK